MSVKIKATYNTDQELAGAIRLVNLAAKECKVPHK